MATNWRLTPKEVSIIAQALANLQVANTIDCFSYKNVAAKDVAYLQSRFAVAASYQKHTNTKSCSCKDCGK